MNSPPGRLRGALSVWRRNMRVWRRYFLAAAAGDLAEPLLYLLAMGYGLGSLVTEIEGMSYIQFIAPGLVVTTTLYSASFEGTYGTYTRMVPQRTFESMLATPLGVGEIVLGEILYAATKAFVAGCAVLLVVVALGLASHPAIALIPVVCLVSSLLFATLAVLIASISPSYDFFNYYITLAVTPMVLFSGIFFPLSQLPVWAQKAAWISPLTHAANACHHLFAGRIDYQLGMEMVWLTVAALLPIKLVMVIMKRRLIH